MILADSSAWVEFLRRTGSAQHLQLRSALESGEELATTDPVSMELLAGASGPREERLIRRALAGCHWLSISGESDWVHAAQVYRTCRQRGVTPRRLLDCLIAAVAIRTTTPILARDRDYELIADHTPLELAR